MTRVAWIGWLLATAAVAAVALAVAQLEHRYGDDWVGGGGGAAIALQLTASLAAWLVAALLLRTARPTGVGLLLAATSIAVLLGALPAARIAASTLFTVALAAGWLVPALPLAAALAYSASGRLDRRVAAAIVGCATAAALITTATFDPAGEGCSRCAGNLLGVAGSPDAHDVATRLSLLTTIAWGAAAAGLAVRGLVFVDATVRRTRAPLAAITAGLACVAVATGVHGLWRFDQAPTELDRTLWLTTCALVLLLAAAIAARSFQARLLARRIGAEIAAALPDRAGIQGALAASAGDPHLALAFPNAPGGAVDAEGNEAAAAAAATVLAVTRGPATIAEIRFRPVNAVANAQVAEVARAAGLGLEYLAGRARLRAELRELTASRIRIVETADARRRALERDLHDGAQPRLISLSAGVRRARDAAEPSSRARYDEALGELSAALGELRSLATAVHPVALTEAGLAAALSDLAERSAVPLRVVSAPAERFPDSVETAAYRVVADALEAAGHDTGRRAVRVAIAATDGALLIEVDVPAADAVAMEQALAHAADRVAALAGRLQVAQQPEGVRVEGSVPCGS